MELKSKHYIITFVSVSRTTNILGHSSAIQRKTLPSGKGWHGQLETKWIRYGNPTSTNISNLTYSELPLSQYYYMVQRLGLFQPNNNVG